MIRSPNFKHHNYRNFKIFKIFQNCTIENEMTFQTKASEVRCTIWGKGARAMNSLLQFRKLQKREI